MLLPDSASKYLSKVFNDDWLREHGFLGDEFQAGTVADLLTKKGGPREVITASPSTRLREVIEVMKREGISQLPVVDGSRVVGVVNESDVLAHVLTEGAPLDSSIEGLVENAFAIVEPTNMISLVGQMFTQGKVVMVMDQQRLVGIITKIDYIDYVSRAG